VSCVVFVGGYEEGGQSRDGGQKTNPILYMGQQGGEMRRVVRRQ